MLGPSEVCGAGCGVHACKNQQSDICPVLLDGGGAGVQSHPRPHGGFGTSLGYVRPHSDQVHRPYVVLSQINLP